MRKIFSLIKKLGSKVLDVILSFTVYILWIFGSTVLILYSKYGMITLSKDENLFERLNFMDALIAAVLVGLVGIAVALFKDMFNSSKDKKALSKERSDLEKGHGEIKNQTAKGHDRLSGEHNEIKRLAEKSNDSVSRMAHDLIVVKTRMEDEIQYRNQINSAKTFEMHNIEKELNAIRQLYAEHERLNLSYSELLKKDNRSQETIQTLQQENQRLLQENMELTQQLNPFPEQRSGRGR